MEIIMPYNHITMIENIIKNKNSIVSYRFFSKKDAIDALRNNHKLYGPRIYLIQEDKICKKDLCKKIPGCDQGIHCGSKCFYISSAQLLFDTINKNTINNINSHFYESFEHDDMVRLFIDITNFPCNLFHTHKKHINLI